MSCNNFGLCNNGNNCDNRRNDRCDDRRHDRCDDRRNDRCEERRHDNWNDNDSWNRGLGDQSFVQHMRRYIGETVIVFTASGGLSGCGFTGVLLSVNCEFLRLDSRQGTAPTCPLGMGNGGCCNDMNNDNNDYNNRRRNNNNLGAVCDIPIDSIVAFCHNAV